MGLGPGQGHYCQTANGHRPPPTRPINPGRFGNKKTRQVRAGDGKETLRNEEETDKRNSGLHYSPSRFSGRSHGEARLGNEPEH
jgi:hypothetical protein